MRWTFCLNWQDSFLAFLCFANLKYTKCTMGSLELFQRKRKLQRKEIPERMLQALVCSRFNIYGRRVIPISVHNNSAMFPTWAGNELDSLRQCGRVCGDRNMSPLSVPTGQSCGRFTLD